MTTATAAPTRFVAVTADTGLTNHAETKKEHTCALAGAASDQP